MATHTNRDLPSIFAATTLYGTKRMMDRSHGAQRGASHMPTDEAVPTGQSTPEAFYEKDTQILDDDSKGLDERFEAEGQRLYRSAPAVQELSTTDHASMETLFTKMAETFIQALKSANHDKPRTPTVEFHGLDHEDPLTFLRDVEDHFERVRVHHDSEKFQIVVQQLKADARRWFDQYRTLITTYTQFRERFLSRYDSSDVQSRAIARLYGERQNPSEDTTVFITKKACLFARIDPFKPECLRARIITDQLRPEIRSRLRGASIETIERLVTAASATARDISEEQADLFKTWKSTTSNHPPPRASFTRDSGIFQQNSRNRSNELSTSRGSAPHSQPQNQERRVTFESDPRSSSQSLARGGSSREDRSHGEYTGGTRDARAPGRPFKGSGDTAGNRGSNRPPTPCKYCPGEQWHYHTQCPNNPFKKRIEGNLIGDRGPSPGPPGVSPNTRPFNRTQSPTRQS